MEEETAKILKLSELKTGARPVTGVSSITPKHPTSGFEWKRYDQPPVPVKSAAQNPNSKILKPFNRPTVLIGTLTLPIHHKKGSVSSSIDCSCFQFSDGSGTICCDILNFHPQVIGRNVRVVAWNFFPLKVGCNLSGFLEIISWEFVDFFPSSTSFPLALGSAGDTEDNSKAKYSLFGILESISPVTVIPCSTEVSSSGSGSRNLSGFLVKMLVCDCKLCGSRKALVALRDFSEGDYKDHCFMQSLIVYFCGSASSWHPAIVRLIGSVVALSGLKKKLVYIRKDDSELMYVTSEKALLQVPEVVRKCIFSEKPELRGLGEVGSYAGTVTGVYMQGMVVELDQELLLLLTDHQLMVPHSLRVGAIVFVRNVHFMNPKFSWTKTLVLGACFITCICVESFSPLEAECHKRSHSQNLLDKFVDSLTFSARLWVLLTITCFRKKFAGISSEKEILGSKHKVGLAQKYAISRLPASAYLMRHGVFKEYCRHSSCAYVEEEDYSLCKFAAPISCFRIYVENRWMKMLLDRESYFDIMGNIKQKNYVSCCGRSYAKLIREIFQSEDTAVCLLGKIKVSLSSGRMQLVDATGSIDVVIPEISSTWDFNRIYEVEDFIVDMQGIPDKLDNLELFPCEPFTCRSIFEGAPLKRETKLSVFLYHHFRDKKVKIYSSPPSKNCKVNFQEFEVGKFHLLWLKHKFPLLHKSMGERVISNRSSAFAEAVILPWDLILPEKDEIADLTGLPLDELRNVRMYEKGVGLKRCKTEKASSDVKSGLCDAGNSKCGCFYNLYCNNCYTEKNHRDLSFKFPCLVSSKIFKCPCQGFVHCTDKKVVTSSGFKSDGRSILLEFDSESLFMYQGLRIGAYYIVKEHRNDVFSTGKGNNDMAGDAMLVTSETHLWSLSFSSDVVLKNSDCSSLFPVVSNHETTPNASQQSEFLPLKLNSVSPESCSDINLCVPSDIIPYLKIDTNVSESGPMKSSVAVEDTELYSGNVAIITNPLLSSGTSPFDLLLPEGDLLSLHGHVVAIHDCNGASFVECLRNESSVYVHRAILSPGTSIICIHVLVDHHMAVIVGALGRNAYPTGFGPGVEATFHRILVLGGQNQYMLISASFIVLDSSNVVDHRYIEESDSVYNTLVVQRATSMGVFPATLISEITHSMNFKQMQLHVRVVGIYVLILQKNKKARHSSTKVRSCSSIADISLAGFIVDDGSSPCCCWANYEIAANILRLPTEAFSSEARMRISSRSRIPVRGEANGSSVGHLNNILRQHRRVIVRNHGSTLDSSCLDLTFSVDSKELMSSFHENLLRGLIMNACFSTLWTVVGSLMDSTAMDRLKKQLNELEMTLLPLQNIWATEVYHSDPLTQSRVIMQGLTTGS